MQKRKFDELVSYFNKKVSEMEIETKYKMELLGMVTALGYAHEKETHDKRTETHACDLISRQAAITEFSCCELTPDGGIDANYAIQFLEQMPSVQPDIIACGDCKHWICHDKRCGYWNHGVKPLDWCCHAERRTDVKAYKGASR